MNRMNATAETTAQTEALERQAVTDRSIEGICRNCGARLRSVMDETCPDIDRCEQRAATHRPRE